MCALKRVPILFPRTSLATVVCVYAVVCMGILYAHIHGSQRSHWLRVGLLVSHVLLFSFLKESLTCLVGQWVPVPIFPARGWQADTPTSSVFTYMSRKDHTSILMLYRLSYLWAPYFSFFFFLLLLNKGISNRYKVRFHDLTPFHFLA